MHPFGYGQPMQHMPMQYYHPQMTAAQMQQMQAQHMPPGPRVMQPHPQPAQAASLNVDDALSYLEEVSARGPTDPQRLPPQAPRPQVKSEFKDNDDVYNEFLEIMKSFKAQT